MTNMNTSDGECEDCEDYEEERDGSETHITDLPYVVFEYILSQLSPYRDLIECKLVSKWWRMSVKSELLLCNRL